jgi:LuxR family transcriptional regulator, maltose regulon positive regulatory protein
MAEPATTSPPAAGVAERDLLLATKLHLPRPRDGFLARQRLLERLAEGAAQELVLVSAPAGFGKTSLLGDWARHSPGPVAWVSLDGGDNDPARFWRYVAAALDPVCEGVGAQVAARLQGPQPASLAAVVTVVVNQLAGLPDQVALVLDDYHLIEAAPVHDSLGMLLERLPAQLRLVLASRADPPLPLARLRARGQLAELRAADLRFTPQETAELLGDVMGLELPAASQAALAARTEGWVAGLQLAGLSLRDHADPAGFVASFSGSQRYILDYLTEEVLARQPEEIVRFLMESSVLERLAGPLCDAVTGRSDSQQLLERIERAHLFLIPLDEVRGWWRYHQLFADLLQARLHQDQPERVPGLHRAAAAWLEDHGLADDALRHALAAGDVTSAARLVERHVDELWVRGERETLQRWLAVLPAELVGARPRLLLARAGLALLGGDLEAGEGALDAAERAFMAATGKAEQPYEPSVGKAASLLANIPARIAVDRAFLAGLRGDAEGTTAFAVRAQAELGEDEWMLAAFTRWHLAVAAWLRGELAEAERAFAASADGWSAAGEVSLAAWACEHLGQLQRAQGRLDAALGTYRRALELTAPPGRPPLPGAGIAQVWMAEVAYQRGELDTALRHLTEGIALCRQLTYTQPLATGLATLAWIRQAEGDPAGALDAIEEAGRVAPSPTVASLLNPVPAQRARLLLAQSDLAAAARWTKGRGLGPDDEPSYPREPEYLVLARVLLAHDLPERALGLLGRLHHLAVAQGRTGSVIEVRALQALALEAAGDHAGALAALAEALTLAAPAGWLRVFLDEGPPMAVLLGKLAAARAKGQAAAAHLPADHLNRLLGAFDQAGLPVLARPRRGGAMVAGMIEPLSARELEVLGLLAAGLSNQAIAEELVVTAETVKSHVAHVLGKLGVANRTQAVARARELGLLR